MSDRWIVIRNWERYQHYRDRKPIWIKYHVELLDDLELRRLPYTTRLLWDQLLLLAARHDNLILYDIDEISSDTRIDREAVAYGLEQLIEGRWIRVLKRKPVLAKRSNPASPHARPRARGEAETETERERTNLPFELTLARTRLLATIGAASDNGTAASLDRYGLPPAAWYAAVEELERRGAKVNNRAKYVAGLFKAWTAEGRYASKSSLS